MISKEEVRQAIQDLKVRKAAGPSSVTGEMIKAAGEQAVDWLTSICNRIVKEEAIPESWQMSELVPIYKGKGDVLECSSSRGIKLLEHGMKVAERVLERRLRQAVEIDKMQFGFRPGTGTTHAIFIARQLQQQQQPFILTRLFFPVYWGQPRLWPSHNILLHLDLSQASSLQSPFSLISSFNTSLHLFLGLPFTPSPSTCSVSILFIQHNSSLLSA